MTNKITKIVITGGPCAGKTTGMSWIQNAFSKRGYKVLFVNEAATELINSGVQPWSFSICDFQTSILQMQLAKEKIYEDVAKTSDFEKILIVCDRGALDGKAFMEQEDYYRIINKINKTENELRDSYDAVFHLVTAAKGAESFYTLENNTARTETVEQARLADDKLINAWNGHPHFKIINNDVDFDNKMKKLIDEIAKVLGEPKSFDSKRRFLIEYPDIEALKQMDNVKEVEIFQTYLKCTENEKIQIRKRGFNNDYIYYQIKTCIKNNQLIQNEKIISESQYEELLSYSDPSRKQLHRTCFYLIENNQYFQIDIYPFINNKAILKVETSNLNEEIIIPSFVKVIEDVTNNSNYLNSELSKH